jgi:hypothetical protein
MCLEITGWTVYVCKLKMTKDCTMIDSYNVLL